MTHTYLTFSLSFNHSHPVSLLSKASQASAFREHNSQEATRVMCSVMVMPKWAEFFFSIILRLRGEGHLASLLSEGGALNRFEWCERWKQGMSSQRHGIAQELREAERSLQQTEEDVAQFPQQYRACPHCRGVFGIDQMNCGQFVCGRDAHGVIGGTARETFGCGQAFTLNQSLPYSQSNQYREDQADLQRLREVLEEKRIAFVEFNRSAELWKKAKEFDVPCMSFGVQGGRVEGLFPCVNLVDYMPEGDDPGTRLLVSVLHHLPRLEHISYLPEMIEVSPYLSTSHKTPCLSVHSNV